MKLRLELDELTESQLVCLHDLLAELDWEPERRKVGRRIDALRGFECEYTHAHTRQWCSRYGCRSR